MKAYRQVQSIAHANLPLSKRKLTLLHIEKRVTIDWTQLQTLKSINTEMLQRNSANYILI